MRRPGLGCPQHPPWEGRCGPDQIFRPQLTLPPVMVLLSVTHSNAPRTPGQLGTVSAAFCAAILDSIGESNRLVISDPDTDTLHLSPRDIINAMTALHRTMTGAELDALRLPLKKNLAALADLPVHIVTQLPGGGTAWAVPQYQKQYLIVVFFFPPLAGTPCLYIRVKLSICRHVEAFRRYFWSKGRVSDSTGKSSMVEPPEYQCDQIVFSNPFFCRIYGKNEKPVIIKTHKNLQSRRQAGKQKVEEVRIQIKLVGVER
jgi:hypothetical protein